MLKLIKTDRSGVAGREARDALRCTNRYFFPLSLSFSFCQRLWLEEIKKPAGLAAVFVPFEEQRGLLINEKQIVISVSV